MNANARIGTVVAGYRLEAQLGRGGMSVVYLAEHLRLGRKVALKLLAPALSEDDSFRERFERESRRAAEIDHPNIIPVYDAGEADGELYIAMRYVRGCDLKTLIARDGPLSIGRALFFLEQAAGALDAAHDRDLIHRDVKPANILIEEPSERAYVTDFGVVKHTVSRGQTKTGFFIGTTDYAAPEQIEGRPVDARTDVYALGCVVYECLAGKPPFERDSDIAVMHAHLSQAPPLLSATRPDLPKTLDTVIARAMAKNKDERHPTCMGLIQAARAAVLEQPVAVPAHETHGGGQAETALAAGAGALATQAQSPDPGTRPPTEVAVPGATAAETNVPPTPPAAPPTDTTPPGVTAVPPEQPTSPPEPPAPPPAPSKGGGGRSWLLGAVAAVVAAVAAGLIVFFVTRSDDGEQVAATTAITEAATTAETAPTTAATETESATETTAATETEAATETTATETTPATPEDELAGLIPPELYQNCAVASTPNEGALATAVCLPPESATGLSGRQPDQWELSIYPDAASLETAYQGVATAQGIENDQGRCTGVSWGGEGAWLHGPDRPGGHRLCYFDGDDAVLVWTHEKLGQEDHRDVLATAVRGNSDHATLFGWWRFWVHRVGKLES